jgi:hypothetical protein
MTRRPARKLDKAPATRKRGGRQHAERQLSAAEFMEQVGKLVARLPPPAEPLHGIMDESTLPAGLPRPTMPAADVLIENPSHYALEVARGVAEARLRQAVAAGELTREQADREWQRWTAALEGRPEAGDSRVPLVIDGQAIDLLDDARDGLTQLVTLRLPRVVIERLRDAAALLHPHRTMAGIATVGAMALLDQIEVQLIRQTGQGIPRRPADTQLGGRPQRLRKPKPRDG